MSQEPPATPFPAATLMLLRDGSRGLEVLMMVRHRSADFAGGAMVFPGGRLEPADRLIAERHVADRACDLGIAALKVAAIRETYEECGILLARIAGTSDMVSLEEPGADEFSGFEAVLAVRHAEPAVDLLVPFANWITPPIRAKRFDAYFFLAPAPPGQTARHDGREAVEVLWKTPSAVIAAADEGVISLMAPTHLNLQKLGRHHTVDDALAAARREPIVTVSPEPVTTPTGVDLLIPAAAGYGVTRFPLAKFRQP